MRKSVLFSLLGALLITTLYAGASLDAADRPFVGLSAEERKWLDENRDSIVLTYEANFPPLEFRTKDGKYTGLSADIVAKIEKLLGVTFQKNPSDDWNDQLASLESGDTHLCAEIIRMPDRERYAYFTAAYISLPLVIITTAKAFAGTVDWSDLYGRRVGVVSGYASEAYVRDSARGRFTVVPVSNVQEGLRSVSFGVLDAFVENLASASYYIEKDTLTNLRVAGATDYSYRLSIGVSRKYPLLYSAVQKALSEISSEDIEASRKRWISLSGEGMLSPETMRLLKLAALFVVLLLLCLAGISYLLKRRLNEKVESLRKAQQELLEQTERLGLATEATNSGVWDFYPATGQAYFSDQWFAMLGLEPGAVEATFAGWIGLLHPEDRTSTDHTLMGYINSGGQGLFEAEYRMRQADGSYRWVLGKGRAIAWDESGRPTRIVGLNLDIQKLKDVQEELRASEEIYRSVIQNMQDVYFRTDAEGGLIMLSPSGLRMYGAESMDEVLGQPISSFYMAPSERTALLAKLQAGGVVYDHEILLRRKNGSPVLAAITASFYRDAAGNILGVEGIFRDITERKQAEEALRQSEAHIRALFNATSDSAILMDCGGVILAINEHGAQRRNLHPEDMIGRCIYDFLPPDSANLRRSQTMETVRTKTPSTYEELRDGAYYFITIYPILDSDGVPRQLASFSRDITERKQAEEALRQSEEKFSRIFEMAPECISFVRLRDSMRIAANATFETITGYPREEAVGRSAKELCIWDDPGMRDEFLKRLQSDGHVKDFEFLLRRKDGTVRRVVSSAQLVAIAGEQCYVNIIHDITEERKMQEVLIQSEKMMSLGSLAAGIAHEINNPLGIVHQAVQHLLMRTDPTHEKNKKAAADLGLDMNLLQQYLQDRKVGVYLEDIQAAAQRASGIIRNMLNFSRRSESKRQMCNLPKIVEQSVFLASSDYDLKKSFDFKNIEIVLDVGDNLPRCGCTETEIEQVILNLLRNAAQAMAMATPPTVNPRIDIRLRAVDAGVRIEVADNGPGMDEEVQRKVLEPFFTTKPPGVGTGLGLSVSFFIITKGHGGRMWLSSAPGKGATFFIELPAENPEGSHA